MTKTRPKDLANQVRDAVLLIARSVAKLAASVDASDAPARARGRARGRACARDLLTAAVNDAKTWVPSDASTMQPDASPPKRKRRRGARNVGRQLGEDFAPSGRTMRARAMRKVQVPAVEAVRKKTNPSRVARANAIKLAELLDEAQQTHSRRIR